MNIQISNYSEHIYPTSKHNFEEEITSKYETICKNNNIETIICYVYPANLNDKTFGGKDKYSIERVDKSNNRVFINIYITY